MVLQSKKRTTAEKTELPSVICTVLLFFFVFSFPMLSFLNTRLLVLAFFAVYCIFRANHIQRRLGSLRRPSLLLYGFGMAVCTAICCCNALLYPDYVKAYSYWKPLNLVIQYIYILWGAIFFSQVFRTVQNFAKHYLRIMVFQSLLIFAAAVSQEVRMFLYDHFYFGDDRFSTSVLYGTRVMGLNLYAAAGSIILFTGCALLIYLHLNCQIKNSDFILLSALIVGATLFVGRTGFYAELVAYFLCFLLDRKIAIKWVNVLLILGVSGAVLLLVFSRLDRAVRDSIVSWALELFHDDMRGRTIGALMNMRIPKLSEEFIFGTNITRGMSPNGVRIDNDSGYIRAYTAIGIVGACVYYLSNLFLLTAARLNLKSAAGKFLVFLTAMTFLFEIKEPFISKISNPFFLMVLLIDSNQKVLAASWQPLPVLERQTSYEGSVPAKV